MAISGDGSGEAHHTYLSESVTQSGLFNGTPYYASPEQCATQADIDSRSDLYSVGIILWQMLTGSLPFTGPLGQVLAMHQFQAPPWSQVSRLPPSVMDILRRLLEKKPVDRFQSPRELREAITASGIGEEGAMLPVPGGKWGAPTVPDVDACAAGIATDLPLGLHYHLVESFQEGDAGRLYRAMDHEAGGAQVAIKILSPRCAVDEDFRDYIREEIAKIQAAAQPILLASPLELEESDAGKFIVRARLRRLVAARAPACAPRTHAGRRAAIARRAARGAGRGGVGPARADRAPVVLVFGHVERRPVAASRSSRPARIAPAAMAGVSPPVESFEFSSGLHGGPAAK